MKDNIDVEAVFSSKGLFKGDGLLAKADYFISVSEEIVKGIVSETRDDVEPISLKVLSTLVFYVLNTVSNSFI